MSCEPCRDHRRRWLRHAGPFERAWIAVAPLLVIGLQVYQIVTGQ